ncbi:hypothetical protein N7447_000720 [Penicillium robsamsonii]|uniref:uncharacterized protein n=1 Tax=Penicillium robsamsonii TaxID=1792511 RepID=UPI0025479900|nr:uncharacterized protein N7447_000720 [Penicillium robsamsonii]KAJ5834694.1 hypothetical protein N7447_000720 [Penicillium robsamsonii]
MFPFLLLLGFVNQSLAQSNSTTLEGWQFDDNSRSSWDIFWTCVSTILACTWTALHISVPKRDETQTVYFWVKAAAWIGAILAPELMAGIAAEELWQARSTAARCNTAFRTVNSDRGDPDPSLPEASKTRKAEMSDCRWGTMQGFCLSMHGVLLQTKDDWTYPVHCGNIVALIKTRVIKSSHLSSRDIQDRAKADSFAKGFTLLQAFWVTCNVIARRASGLPSTALEIATVAYVACAFATYITWWNKPKDMVTPITIYLPYDRNSESMSPQVRDILDGEVENWVHSDAFARDVGSPVWQIIVAGLYIPLIVLLLIFTPWLWKGYYQEFKENWAVIMKNWQVRKPPASHSDDSDGDHQDEENPQETRKACQTSKGGYINEEACQGPELEPVIINGDHQDEEIPQDITAASGSQQPRNEPKVDGRLTVTETSQGKEPFMGSSEASKNDHQDVETHQETEPASESQHVGYSPEDDERMTIMEWTNIAHFYMFAALVFCGIHVAAWNSTFPTKEEQIVWRVLSLCSLLITCPLYFKFLWLFYRFRRTLGDKEKRVSSISWSKAPDLLFVLIWFCCYATARWGIIILMFISLRALPASSYVTVNWLASIPHI